MILYCYVAGQVGDDDELREIMLPYLQVAFLAFCMYFFIADKIVRLPSLLKARNTRLSGFHSYPVNYFTCLESSFDSKVFKHLLIFYVFNIRFLEH